MDSGRGFGCAALKLIGAAALRYTMQIGARSGVRTHGRQERVMIVEIRWGIKVANVVRCRACDRLTNGIRGGVC